MDTVPPDDSSRFDAALRDAFAGLSNEVQSSTPPQGSARFARGTSNYELLGEIAQGGMGTIFRARSQQLGREVALKILRPNLKFSSEAGLRFLTEARIAGRLQHPGIVPIYDVGTLEDGQRYFAMKLVDGHTFADDLRARSSPQDSVLHFIGILEQVCHAMAYAHSRGVAHRDLKPANIMIGGFGEVLVMDWGLAKILNSDESATDIAESTPTVSAAAADTLWSATESILARSVTGTVFGTPAYMSPEQARGEVQSIDARTDVFALGSILVEILTGVPAYPGNSAAALKDAVDGNLTNAFERLDHGHCDPDLSQIARTCLAADANDRPKSAQWLSQKLSEYLSNVAKRSEQAKLEAATERAKAASARKARNLTIALSLLAVVSVAGGSVVYFEWTRQRNAQISLQIQSVQEALFESNTAAQQKQWPTALAHLNRALALPDFNEVPVDLRKRLEQAQADASSALKADSAESSRVARNASLLSLLSSHRVSELMQIEYVPDWRAVDARFTAAFQQFDLAPDVGSIEEAHRRFAATGIEVEIAGVLDEWANYRRLANNPTGTARLVELAERLDPDPVRNEIRDALRDKDITKIGSLETSLDASSLSPLTLRILARALAERGKEEASLQCLRAAQRAYPSDFTTNLALAHSLRNLGKKHSPEAVRYYTSARALRPDSVEALAGLGGVLLDGLQEYEAALDVFRSAQRLFPQDPHITWATGNALLLLKRLDEAVAQYQHALELQPDFVRAMASLANAYQRQGKMREAREMFEKVVVLNVEDGKSYYVRGLSFMMLGKTNEAIADFRKTIELCPTHAGGYNNLGVLLNDKLNDYAGAEAAFRSAIRLEPKVAKQHTNLGNALRGLKRDDEAAESFRQALLLDPKDFWACYGLSGVLLDQKQFDEALAIVRQAEQIDPRSYYAAYQMGLIQKARKDYRAAAAAFEKTLKLNSKLSEARVALAEVLEKIEAENQELKK
ncbi:MAG: protein kinase domain-containing protein [Planctomycetota bacterium]